MSRLPVFVVKSYERQTILADTLKRKLKSQRLMVAMHLNDPTFKQVNALRSLIKSKDPKADYRHARNRMTKFATAGTQFAPISPLLESVTGLAFTPSPVLAAHVATEYLKTNPEFVILGGVMDGHLLNKDDVKTLSELPLSPG